MVQISDERLDEFIELSKEKNIEYKDRQEAYESASNLVGFFELLHKIDRQEQMRKRRLENEPKGFSMEGSGRNCRLCRQSIQEDMWYDEYGMKCMDCQKAVNDNVVPKSIFQDDKSYITSNELSWKYGIRHQTIKKYIREEELLKQLLHIIDQIDLNTIAAKRKFQEELERFRKFARGVLGQVTDGSTGQKVVDMKMYVRYVLQEGTREEKHEILECLDCKIMLKNQKIFIETKGPS
ncbi:MAG: hypothetical protein Q8P90_04330 [bacterium]|nr:hypothetical protein [bacterium]